MYSGEAINYLSFLNIIYIFEWSSIYYLKDTYMYSGEAINYLSFQGYYALWRSKKYLS